MNVYLYFSYAYTETLRVGSAVAGVTTSTLVELSDQFRGDWFGSGDKLGIQKAEKQSRMFLDTANQMADMARETLIMATLPNFYLPAAAEILTYGSFCKLWRCLSEKIIPPFPMATVDRPNQVIGKRLVCRVLSISYWRELASKYFVQESGRQQSVQVNPLDPTRSLMVVHTLAPTVNEAEVAERSIRIERLSMECKLTESIVTKGLKLGGVEAIMDVYPTVLSIPILQPHLKSEQLLVSLDTHIVNCLAHVPVIPTNPFSSQIQNCQNMDQVQLEILVTKLRYWITVRRIEKTLHQLTLLYDMLGRHEMFIKLHEQSFNVLVVEFMEKPERECEIQYSFYYLVTNPCSVKDDLQELAKHEVGHTDTNVETNGVGPAIKIVQFPTVPGLQQKEEKAFYGRRLSATIRQSHKPLSLWVVKWMLCGSPIISTKSMGKPFYSQLKLENPDDFEKTVTALVGKWNSIAHLQSVVREYAHYSRVVELINIQSYNYRNIVVEYGPGQVYSTTITWNIVVNSLLPDIRYVPLLVLIASIIKTHFNSFMIAIDSFWVEERGVGLFIHMFENLDRFDAFLSMETLELDKIAKYQVLNKLFASDGRGELISCCDVEKNPGPGPERWGRI